MLETMERVGREAGSGGGGRGLGEEGGVWVRREGSGGGGRGQGAGGWGR